MSNYSDWAPFNKPYSDQVTNTEIDKVLRSNEKWVELDFILQSANLKVGDGDWYLRELQVEYSKNKTKGAPSVDNDNQTIISIISRSTPTADTSFIVPMLDILKDESWEKHEEFTNLYWLSYYKQKENLRQNKKLVDEINDLEKSIVKSLVEYRKNNSFIGLGLNKVVGTEFCITVKKGYDLPDEELVYKVTDESEQLFNSSGLDPIVTKYRVPLENVSN